jgi:chromosome segregation ATPase
MSQLPTLEAIGKTAKDAAYVTIGLGVLAAQKLQVQRHELSTWFGSQVDGARTSFDGLQHHIDDRVKALEERFTALEDQMEAMLEAMQERLPEQVREFAGQARDLAKQARSELRERVGRPSAA